MVEHVPTRDEAFALLRQYNKNEALIKHALAVEAVKKKWKEKSFAAGVNREVIEKGAAMLGVDVNQLIEGAIAGMREAAEAIGLKGDVNAQGL